MITITGASGKIGSKTAIQLLENGKDVRVVGRNAKSLETLKKSGAEIVAGNMNDVNFLNKAFTNTEAVLLMLPPDKDALDFGAFQDEIGEAQVKAIVNAGVKNVVFISSQGAHDIVHTGTVKGLGRHEIRLNKLPADVNVLSIRAEGFMENCIESLKLFNTIATPLRPDVSTGLIATNDIACFTAERLLKPDFAGKNHQDLLGDRDYVQTEIATIVGEAIGRPELKYIQYSYEEYNNALLKAGISQNRSNLITERYKAINDGYFNKGIRNESSTTKTSLAYFAKAVLKPMFG
jgi:uncharacterized protein YbjT (DUF2867 family)